MQLICYSNGLMLLRTKFVFRHAETVRLVLPRLPQHRRQETRRVIDCNDDKSERMFRYQMHGSQEAVVTKSSQCFPADCSFLLCSAWRAERGRRRRLICSPQTAFFLLSVHALLYHCTCVLFLLSISTAE